MESIFCVHESDTFSMFYFQQGNRKLCCGLIIISCFLQYFFYLLFCCCCCWPNLLMNTWTYFPWYFRQCHLYHLYITIVMWYRKVYVTIQHGNMFILWCVLFYKWKVCSHLFNGHTYKGTRQTFPLSFCLKWPKLNVLQ